MRLLTNRGKTLIETVIWIILFGCGFYAIFS